MNAWEKALLIGIALAALALFLFLLPIKHADADQPATTLTWTAPGDDGDVGRASTYQMRWRTVGISATDTLGWWNSATQITGLPIPSASGSSDSVKVTLPTWATTYYFLLIACDDGLPGTGVPNCSKFSNLAVKAFGAAPDTIPPRRVFDLLVR